MTTTAIEEPQPRRAKSGPPSEFLFSVLALLVATIVVQAIYALHVRPTAQAIMERDRIQLQTDPAYVSERSFYIIIKDYEQEAEIILMLWALAILGFRAREQTY